MGVSIIQGGSGSILFAPSTLSYLCGTDPYTCVTSGALCSPTEIRRGVRSATNSRGD